MTSSQCSFVHMRSYKSAHITVTLVFLLNLRDSVYTTGHLSQVYYGIFEIIQFSMCAYVCVPRLLKTIHAKKPEQLAFCDLCTNDLCHVIKDFITANKGHEHSTMSLLQCI